MGAYMVGVGGELSPLEVGPHTGSLFKSTVFPSGDSWSQECEVAGHTVPVGRKES